MKVVNNFWGLNSKLNKFSPKYVCTKYWIVGIKLNRIGIPSSERVNSKPEKLVIHPCNTSGYVEKVSRVANFV